MQIQYLRRVIVPAIYGRPPSCFLLLYVAPVLVHTAIIWIRAMDTINKLLRSMIHGAVTFTRAPTNLWLVKIIH